jgi:hypothetical protein
MGLAPTFSADSLNDAVKSIVNLQLFGQLNRGIAKQHCLAIKVVGRAGRPENS